MKTTRALFLTVLGSLLSAAGFAFAGAYDQLKSDPFGDGRSASISPAGESADGVSLTAAIPAPAPAPAPTPAKPVAGENVKKFLSEHKGEILLSGIGAYLGYALIGGIAGILTGGLFFLALFALAAL